MSCSFEMAFNGCSTFQKWHVGVKQGRRGDAKENQSRSCSSQMLSSRLRVLAVYTAVKQGRREGAKKNNKLLKCLRSEEKRDRTLRSGLSETGYLTSSMGYELGRTGWLYWPERCKDCSHRRRPYRCR